ncbi:Thioredoxin-like protein yls8, variant 2 [Stylosanthes scabra]|uniref:Thioredoxin-like protein yls8, variant 2 n=1 Tax=Stylosanthes scabra TaxID=79078 RepID=A0ABU6XDY9_9FABA|nr:Thioredoxin-like protein yls8, variant 2 [Stylosanthes scabra]
MMEAFNLKGRSHCLRIRFICNYVIYLLVLKIHQMDEVLAAVAETLKNFAVIYLVDITEVPDFNTMYELYDPCTVMFFFRNKHIMIDLGTGNNNKINWALKDKQEFIDIVETVYRGARKGRGLVISPKDYSTKYRY